MYKNNVLIIKPFYGYFKNDKNILHSLGQLLQRIIIEAKSNDNARISINKL